MTRQIHFNAFDMNCVGHQSPGLWAHPQDQSWRYKDLDYWQNLARTLEKGVFDGIFIADVIGYYDVYKGSLYHALQQAAQVPVNDPLQLAAPIALATEHLGIGITASTSFEHPYTFARRIATADHHTKGRVGWNIVTSYLESGAKNVGDAGLRRHDNRYDVANEYLEVIYKLLEGSWEEGAVVRDRERPCRRSRHPRNAGIGRASRRRVRCRIDDRRDRTRPRSARLRPRDASRACAGRSRTRDDSRNR